MATAKVNSTAADDEGSPGCKLKGKEYERKLPGCSRLVKLQQWSSTV
jgi:hypothetical protein